MMSPSLDASCWPVLLATRIAGALAGRFGASRSAAVLERRRDQDSRSSTSSRASRRKAGPTSCPPTERIATFDNDGTLWIEQPMYVQFALRARPRQGAGAAASGVEDQAAVQGGAGRRPEGAGAAGEKALVELDGGDACRHDDGGVREDRHRLARDRARTRDSSGPIPTGLPADAGAAGLSARQRLQDLHRLRRRHRVHAAVDREDLRHPAGAGRRLAIKTKFEMRDGKPVLFRLPEINFIDDKAGKPVGINEHIGRRPIAAFGNSDGDLEMLQWTTLGGSGARFGLIVHHTDAEREYAYDRTVAHRQARHGAGRRGGEQVDRGRHEEGLEADLRIRLGNKIPPCPRHGIQQPRLFSSRVTRSLAALLPPRRRRMLEVRFTGAG